MNLMAVQSRDQEMFDEARFCKSDNSKYISFKNRIRKRVALIAL